jgi:hypothetical protein
VALRTLVTGRGAAVGEGETPTHVRHLPLAIASYADTGVIASGKLPGLTGWALCVTSVAARHLAPSTIKDDVSHELQITNKRVWCGGRVLDHCSGPVERVKQLIGMDSFDENQPVVRAEILDGKFHELQHRVLVCMGQLEPCCAASG